MRTRLSSLLTNLFIVARLLLRGVKNYPIIACLLFCSLSLLLFFFSTKKESYFYWRSRYLNRKHFRIRSFRDSTIRSLGPRDCQTMPRLSCCVSVCKGDPQTPTKDPSVTLIPFPKDGALADQWRAVSGLSPDFVIKPLTRICSKHFRSGKRSLNPDSEDYIPSVFEAPQQVTKKSYCMTCRKVTLNCPCKSKEESADDESEEETNGGKSCTALLCNAFMMYGGFGYIYY